MVRGRVGEEGGRSGMPVGLTDVDVDVGVGVLGGEGEDD